MDSSLALSNVLAFFAAMLVLAAVPSTSVLIVSARAASLGLVHGVLAAAGVVLGDIIFIGLAVSGLALLMQSMGAAFAVLKYAGGCYLIGLGIYMWRSTYRTASPATATMRQKHPPQHGRQAPDDTAAITAEPLPQPATSSRLSSFLAGLAVTLGDQKAVIFYLGFFPAFFDVASLSAADLGVIITTTMLAVGGVKVAYALGAARARVLLDTKFSQLMSRIAAAVIFTIGLSLMGQAWVA